jgi:ribonuclease P protein component
MGNGFPKAMRLSGRESYAAIFARGLVATDSTLVIHALTNDLSFTRIGLSVSKKVGTAPTRNYWKRCIREAFRRNRTKLPTSLDIIVRPRRGARPDYIAIELALVQLLKRLSRQLAKR